MRNKKSGIVGLFLLLALVVAFPLTAAETAVVVSASADGVTKRIRFARGKRSATVSNNVMRGDRDTYIIGAGAAQTMLVKITSFEKNAVFQIEAPDGSFLSGAGEMDDAMNWTGKLPAGGDYKIVVGGTRGNANYKLTVSVK